MSHPRPPLKTVGTFADILDPNDAQAAFRYERDKLDARTASSQRVVDLYRFSTSSDEGKASEYLLLKGGVFEEIFAFLEREIYPQYKVHCPVAQHMVNIQQLSEYATDIGNNLEVRKGTKTCRGLFSKRGFRIGPAQKLLNYMLKLFWCNRWIAEPPHCPADYSILQAAKPRTKSRWTQWEAVSEYEEPSP